MSDRIPAGIKLPECERIDFCFFSEQQLRQVRVKWGAIIIHDDDPPLVEIPDAVTNPHNMKRKPAIGVHDSDGRFVLSSRALRGPAGWALPNEPRFLASASEDACDLYYLGGGEDVTAAPDASH